MKKINPAVKSLATIALYLVLLIGMWSVLAKVVFPGRTTTDPQADFIAKRGGLLAQVAENAMDPDQWTGIMDAQEVKDALAEGGIVSVEGGEREASFWMTSADPDATLRYIYLPDGEYQPPAAVTGSLWTMTGDGAIRRWTGGTGGQQYVTVRQLTDHFVLEEARLQTDANG